MEIGYACKTLGVPGTQLKTCILKNADTQTLYNRIDENLSALNNTLAYNQQNGIRLFRISSDLIPFGSNAVNTLPWQDLFSEKWDEAGDRIKASGARVSMHPGQYTVLNSPEEKILGRAVEDLEYHTKILERLHAGTEAKIVLHIGGVYGNKIAALERFRRNFEHLPERVKRRIVIENDDKCYSAGETLTLAQTLGIPAVFDTLHHAVNSGEGGSAYEWIASFRKTWSEKDGPQKIHYSEQAEGKPAGCHSERIDCGVFLPFCRGLTFGMPDIMLEVKDKNLSAVKCLNLLFPERGIGALEKEWSRYKNAVLEKSQNVHDQICHLLQEKEGYPAKAFYSLLEEVLRTKTTAGCAINAAQHVWGYFESRADEREKAAFERTLKALADGKTQIEPVKRLLWRLAEKYQEDDLLYSLYFHLNR